MSEATGFGFEHTDIGYLIAPEQPTPEQWADARRAEWMTGEKRLLLAVLEDAVRCYIEYGENGKVCRKKKLFDEAERWIQGEGDSDLSFEYVCGELGIDHDWLRKRLQIARASGVRKIARCENMIGRDYGMTVPKEMANG